MIPASLAETLFDAAEQPLVLVKRDNLIVRANRAFERLSGWKRRSLEGKKFLSDFVHTAALTPPKARGKSRTAPETSFVDRAGKKIPVSAHVAPVPRTTFRLVSFRLEGFPRRAGSGSHPGWEQFRQFFEENEEAILVFDPSTCAVVGANRSACRLFACSHDELVAGGITLFAAPDELDNLKSIICAAVPAERPYVMTYLKADGAKSVLRFRSHGIDLPEGRLVYCSFRDIGEKIRMKEEMRFRQTQLIHANKMAALGMLVSGVAHEISNPNNFIMHNAQIISDTWKDSLPILNEYYRENGDYYLGGIPLSECGEVIPRLIYGILDGSRRIKGIVENLRDFVVTDRARLDSLVDLASVASDAVALLQSEISARTRAFSLRCDEDLPRVRGSAQKLEQVITNLVMNALQSLTSHDKRVTVNVTADTAEGRVLLTVEDEGVGMSEEVKARISEPFFSTKLDKGGTGLGLYISLSIVKEHQGTLTFVSHPGAGTVATVSLPAAAKETGHDQNREPFTTGIAG